VRKFANDRKGFAPDLCEHLPKCQGDQTEICSKRPQTSALSASGAASTQHQLFAGTFQVVPANSGPQAWKTATTNTAKLPVLSTDQHIPHGVT